MLEILDRAGITDCKPCTTPVDMNLKLEKQLWLLEPLQYLIFSRPDISYAI
jgi:hypothetical protein